MSQWKLGQHRGLLSTPSLWGALGGGMRLTTRLESGENEEEPEPEEDEDENEAGEPEPESEEEENGERSAYEFVPTIAHDEALVAQIERQHRDDDQEGKRLFFNRQEENERVPLDIIPFEASFGRTLFSQKVKAYSEHEITARMLMEDRLLREQLGEEDPAGGGGGGGGGGGEKEGRLMGSPPIYPISLLKTTREYAEYWRYEQRQLTLVIDEVSHFLDDKQIVWSSLESGGEFLDQILTKTLPHYWPFDPVRKQLVPADQLRQKHKQRQSGGARGITWTLRGNYLEDAGWIQL